MCLSSSMVISVCVCVCVYVRACVRACVRVCQRKTKIELTVWGKKCPFPWTGFEPVPVLPITRGQARLASVETNTLDTHPPAPSWDNHAWKHSNSYLQDRNVRHLQGPPLSWTKCVREKRKIELTVCVCVCVCVASIEFWIQWRNAHVPFCHPSPLPSGCPW